MGSSRGDKALILAKDFNYLLGKQDGYAQAPFNVRVGGAYERGYKDGQKLYNEQQQRGQGPR